MIFVFGSNVAGRHGKGAALHEKMHYGAIYGQGEGLQGNSYGIPTKDAKLKTLPLEEISAAVQRFKRYAHMHFDKQFQVTAIGCGLAGYLYKDIAPMFEDAPPNCKLCAEFRAVLDAKHDT